MLDADKIAKEEFQETLGRYPVLLQKISVSKQPKGGEDKFTLEQLDHFRFEEAPSRYYRPDALEDQESAPRPLTVEDLTQLVRWKLKHGKFRPNLLQFAQNQDEKVVKNTTEEAFRLYKQSGFNVAKPLAKLCEQKGIGPATASLLLSVHDPKRVPFFSDELFLWLCHKGKKMPMKYNAKEYAELVEKVKALVKRLGGDIDASDVEKVAFVLMREDAAPPAKEEAKGEEAMKESIKSKSLKSSTTKAISPPPMKPGSKRKAQEDLASRTAKAKRQQQEPPDEPNTRQTRSSKARNTGVRSDVSDDGPSNKKAEKDGK